MEIIVYAQKLMDLEDSISILIYEIYCREKDKNSTKSSFCSQTSTKGQKSQK